MTQIKSKKRVADHGEVFTSEREVNAMLDLVKPETENIESRFLEPACGNGNFLAEVLRRKLKVVEDRYAKSQIEFERNAVIAISSIYGIDILEDNAAECRQRLFNIFADSYKNLYQNDCKAACFDSVKFLLSRNILWGDALDFTNPETKQPIIFSEWKLVNDMIERKDFIFEFLVEQSYQHSLLNDMDGTNQIDKPKNDDFSPIHFLELGKQDNAD